MTTWIVCEGPPDGLDARVLDRLVVTRLQPATARTQDVRIQAAYGETGLGSVAEVLRGRSSAMKGPADVRTLIIEDRNLREPGPIREKWAHLTTHGIDNNTRIQWTRHEIESYLLEPAVVARALSDIRARGVRCPPGHVRPESTDAARDLLISKGRELFAEHAARLTVRDLKAALGQGRHPVSLTLPGPIAGEDPMMWAVWRAAVLRGVQDFCAQIGEIGDHEALKPGMIARRYDAHMERMDEPGFITDGTWLLDLGGHELLGSLAAVTGISVKKLSEKLLDALEHIDLEGGCVVSEDFAILRAVLER